MATITRKELIKIICERCGAIATQTEAIMQEFMDQIVISLARGDRIELREFGVFELRRRSERKGRNPKTGTFVPVPARTIVVFKAGKVMKDRVADTIPQPKVTKKSLREAATAAIENTTPVTPQNSVPPSS